MVKQAFLKQLTRRVVLAAGVMAAAGCGSGGGEDTGVAVSSGGGGGGGGSGGGGGGVNGPPAWTTVPTVTFTLGVPATFPIAAFVSDPDGDPLTITHSGVLPAGVTFDAANKRFVYDGSGAVQSTDNHVLTADDLK